MKNSIKIFAVLALTLFLSSQSFAAEKRLAPDFILPDINHNIVTLSGYRDKQPVLLLFWTTWCPFCRRGLKLMDNKYSELSNAGLRIFGVNVADHVRLLGTYLKNNPFKFKVILDSTSSVAYSYNVRGIPNFVLINKKGHVVYQGNSFPYNYKKLIEEQ
jgi:peroxiredoxin